MVLVLWDYVYYFFGVMCLVVGMVLLVFNGWDGEWDVEIIVVLKKSGELICVE